MWKTPTLCPTSPAWRPGPPGRWSPAAARQVHLRGAERGGGRTGGLSDQIREVVSSSRQAGSPERGGEVGRRGGGEGRGLARVSRPAYVEHAFALQRISLHCGTHLTRCQSGGPAVRSAPAASRGQGRPAAARRCLGRRAPRPAFLSVPWGEPEGRAGGGGVEGRQNRGWEELYWRTSTSTWG